MAKKPTLLGAQFRQYGAEMLQYIARHVQDKATAEDLTQEVFLRAQRTENWPEIEDPRAYLFATARNLLTDHFRQRKAQQQDDILVFDEALYKEHGTSEEKRLEARSDLRMLATAIQSLPPRARKAFMLNRVYRFSYGEVGKMMRISPRTVEHHVAKGLHACAHYLASAGGNAESSPENSVIDLARHQHARSRDE